MLPIGDALAWKYRHGPIFLKLGAFRCITTASCLRSNQDLKLIGLDTRAADHVSGPRLHFCLNC